MELSHLGVLRHLKVDTKQEMTSLLCLQVSWLARPVLEDRLISIILILPKSETAVEAGRDRPEERRAQRRGLIGNQVEILENLLARNLGTRMTSLGGSLVLAIKKAKAKTSLAVTEAQGVAIRMDALARRGNINVAFLFQACSVTNHFLIFVLLS